MNKQIVLTIAFILSGCIALCFHGDTDARMTLPVVAGSSAVASCAANLHESDFATDLSDWDSETDPNTEGAVSGGAYAISVNDNDGIYVTESLGSNYDELWIEFDVKTSVLDIGDAWGASEVVNIKNSSGATRAQIALRQNHASGNWTGISVYLTNDSYTPQSAAADFTIAADTFYSVKVRIVRASSDVASDGGMYVYWNGASSPGVSLTGVDNYDLGLFYAYDVGAFTPANTSDSYTLTVDNVKIREDDCFE